MTNEKHRQLITGPDTNTQPVRIRLRRINASYAKPYPPDGLKKTWWGQLNAALGTTSSAFVDATLQQLIEAARLPDGAISETAVNAALAFVENAKATGEVESSLLIQMACTHMAAMAVLGRVAGANGGSRNVSMMASASSKLLNAFAHQCETLRRLRSGGSQFVRVEHVHVSDGGQAIIGNVARSKKIT
jgi:N-methylhydantoinase B/oxoprolinase/acetone carboxylase alpha subunit